MWQRMAGLPAGRLPGVLQAKSLVVPGRSKAFKERRFCQVKAFQRMCPGFFLLLLFFFFSLFFRAPPVAYGSSQARGSNQSFSCGLCRSLCQCPIPSLLSRVRDQTCIFMDTSWVHYHWATMGSLYFFFFLAHLGFLKPDFSFPGEVDKCWAVNSQCWKVGKN